MGRPRRRARAGPEKTIRVRIFLQGEFSKSLCGVPRIKNIRIITISSCFWECRYNIVCKIFFAELS